jgi:hypothetical protein
MPVGKEYRAVIGEALERLDPAEDREGTVPADLKPSRQTVLTALKATPGAEEIIKKIPNLEALELWGNTAYFSVCSKSGTAQYLDIWDADHFDGFTDMQRSVNDCRAWFSGDGYSGWGSAQTKTGRINCYFTAPSSGPYVCTAAMQSYPTGNGAEVECLIDNFSFGPLGFTGTIYQPHPCNLSAGPHHFRIRQRTGSFFFLSLSVWSLGVFA